MNLKLKLLIKLFLQYFLAWSIFLCGLFASCSKEEATDLSLTETDELRLGAAITGITRATDAGFEIGDTLGIFITKWQDASARDTLKESGNYTDNVLFRLENLSNDWVAEYPVYFPSDDNKIDLYAYYPYRNPAFVSGTSLGVKVFANQSVGNHYTRSDFMTAKTLGVSRTPNKVPLIFDHRLSQMVFILKPGAGFSVADLLPARLKIINAITDATFDLRDSLPVAGSVRSDIIPAGSWTAGSESLTGMKAILIPQELNPDTYVEITLGSRRFTYKPASVHLNPGCSRVFTITVNNTGLDITTEINPWDNCPPVNGDAYEEFPELVINLKDIDWSKSNVYKVMDKMNMQVAEICKEYLPFMGFQAIVVYPVEYNALNANLQKGFVAQILDTMNGLPFSSPLNKPVHGGHISFTLNDLQTHYKYSEGTFLPLNKVYLCNRTLIKAEGNTQDTGIVVPDVMRDLEGNRYPIVKLGTQYWQRENMKSLPYTGNSYIYKDKRHMNLDSNFLLYGRLYDWESVMSVVPVYWKVPSDNEWKILELYLGMSRDQADEMGINRGRGIGTILKSIDLWEDLDGTNFTNFDMRPGGKGNIFEDSVYFSQVEHYGYWWSSTINQDTLVYARRLEYIHPSLTRCYGRTQNFLFSLRLLRSY